MSYTGSNVDSVVDVQCTVMGSVAGTSEGAFKCASGFSMDLGGGLWFALAIACFLFWWLRLIWKAWGKTQGKRAVYTVQEFFMIAVKPLAMFFLLVSVLQTFR